jgi:hypothetical protein
LRFIVAACSVLAPGLLHTFALLQQRNIYEQIKQNALLSELIDLQRAKQSQSK